MSSKIRYFCHVQSGMALAGGKSFFQQTAASRMEAAKAKASDTGPAKRAPSTPRAWERSTIEGIRKRIWRERDRKEAWKGLPSA